MVPSTKKVRRFGIKIFTQKNETYIPCLFGWILSIIEALLFMNEAPLRILNSLLLDFMTSIYNVFFMPSKPHNKKSKRKNTSLRLEESVLKKLKIYAVKKDTSVQQIIEDLVVGLLKNKK